MQIFYGLLLMFVLCSSIHLSEQWCSTCLDLACGASRECYDPCFKAFGRAHGKCMNNKCRCYT
uniref:TSA: Tityus bahiensis Tbah02600 mRNA sequence n=1 Tax=Tityus bahiensis TaxID=50343 RepID=A0A0C9S3A0_TITBA